MPANTNHEGKLGIPIRLCPGGAGDILDCHIWAGYSRVSSSSDRMALDVGRVKGEGPGEGAADSRTERRGRGGLRIREGWLPGLTDPFGVWISTSPAPLHGHTQLTWPGKLGARHSTLWLPNSHRSPRNPVSGLQGRAACFLH